MKLRNTILAGAMVPALALTACGGTSTDPNDENHINGMEGYMAAMLCQKAVAKRVGVNREDMADVDKNAIRKINVDNEWHWYYQGTDQHVPGGNYSCNVYPTDKDNAKVDVN